MAHNVAKETSTEGLMKVLSDMYEKPSANNWVHALILLASLPNSWEPMQAAVSNSDGSAKLNFNDVRDRILAEEVRRIDSREMSASNSALNIEGRSVGAVGGLGHMKKVCTTPKKNKNKNKGNVANAVTEEVQDALLLSIDGPIDSWVLDSGASFHTTAQREILENFVVGNHGKVYLADGEPLDIVGIESIHLKMSNGVVWKIQKVRHVPKLMRNLISVGQLDDKGHVTFSDGSWKITKGSMVVARDLGI
ncbi:hypothetical protein ZIOFF_011946 [Zingiber officinale]|uniref:Retrovirus-related Pol polyprotein from transposon TNT 1-94-like beta-barrel domain-containing protein n=1 Tax=Zingiber officinale TaxID=94328 RepID=A0A8J5I709_ZINOF|nr:hypothetical protein ZIOFF_011946 [Zingiber officinale]